MEYAYLSSLLDRFHTRWKAEMKARDFNAAGFTANDIEAVVYNLVKITHQEAYNANLKARGKQHPGTILPPKEGD